MTGDLTRLPAPGTPIRIAMRKWDESPHWTSGEGAVYLGEDEYGWWYAQGQGVEYTRPGRTLVVPDLQIGCFARDRWHAALLHTVNDGHVYRVYVDVTSPPQWRLGPDGIRELTAIDLDLDVVEFFDGRIALEDEDEFAEHTVELGYPEHVVATARAEADLLLHEVRAGDRRYSDEMLHHWQGVFERLG